MSDRAAAAAICAGTVAGVRRSPHYLTATAILTYLAFGSEIDLASLGNDPTKRFYTTRLDDQSEAGLSVHELAKSSLERHPFGLLQPAADSPAAALADIDLVLVPGLVFDTAGYRLGYGKGLYDRLLPRLRAGVPLLGVVHTDLIVAELPREAHDVPMTHLATEQGVRLARPRR